jgi:uncharacterized protein
MILEGVVSNVANFGAFVDIGVHQDGLVHISALTDRYVSDPREIVKAGDIVKVKVLDVEVARKRIALTMRLNDEPKQENRNSEKGNRKHFSKPKTEHRQPTSRREPQANSAFADAFKRAKR